MTQYRAVFVVNCKIGNDKVTKQNNSRKRNRGKGLDANYGSSTNIETFKQVLCSVCSTEVGVIDQDEVYHFYNVLPSES